MPKSPEFREPELENEKQESTESLNLQLSREEADELLSVISFKEKQIRESVSHMPASKQETKEVLLKRAEILASLTKRIAPQETEK